MEKMASSQAPVSPRELCKLLKLHRRQQRMCRRGKGIPETLIKATRLSVLECQHQFKYERWNCSLGQYDRTSWRRKHYHTQVYKKMDSKDTVHIEQCPRQKASSIVLASSVAPYPTKVFFRASPQAKGSN
ncbi:hypothetical protein C0Q70_01569 [Pomacea canaliculata]|uniref:Protein Wnt n=1 Tax=Pomacea canaliculata TaxID=400727 RepID=A0A2T7PZU4_POMCA|nr:hypothetical protein C0Q70_01569 [Pomacea canaliculata]